MTRWILTLSLMSGKIKVIPTIPYRLLDQVKFCTSTINGALYEGHLESKESFAIKNIY
jgi:hypothetical protein